MMRKIGAMLGLASAALLLGLGSAALAQDLKGLPSGGSLKDVPTLQGLPGVRMDLGSNGSPQGNCTQESANSYNVDISGRDYYPAGTTMQRCQVGRFSFGVVTPPGMGGNTIPGMQQFHGHYHPVEQGWRPTR